MANSSPEPVIVISSDSEDSGPDNANAPAESSGGANVNDKTKENGGKTTKMEAYLRAEAAAQKAYKEWKSECVALGRAAPLPHFTGYSGEVQRRHGAGPSHFVPLPRRQQQPQSGAVALGSRRIPVKPPTKGEKPKPAPIVKGYKNEDVRKHADEVFKVASRNIARFVAEMQDRTGYQRINRDKTATGIDAVHVGKVPAEMPHEQELEMMVRPDVLRTGEWEPPRLELYKGHVEIQDGHVRDIVTAMAKNQDIINAKLDRMMSILHLHSVAHVASIKAGNELRLFCLADAKEKDEVYMQLQLSLRSIALAADRDLMDLPFRTLSQLVKFFSNQERTEKLAFFILTYIDFKRGFATAVINVLLDRQLQQICQWNSGEMEEL